MYSHHATRRRAVAVAALAAMLLSGLAVPAYGDPRSDKRRIDAEVARAAAILEGATGRAQAAAARYASATSALPGARADVDRARGEVAAAEVRANTARREALAAGREVAAARRRSEAAARRVLDARERVASFVTATYKGGDIATMNVLLGGRDALGIAERLGYVDRVLTDERGVMNELNAARMAARQSENDATVARQRAEAARRRAEQAVADARSAHARAGAAVIAVTVLVGQRQQALAAARQERAASLARYAQARAEAARVAAELRAWEARQNPGGGTFDADARLMMPVNGWKSSDFGQRYDPYYHVWQLHAGIDIAAGGGQPIRAAAGGRVIRAGWNGGYGNFTCVSHGRLNGRGLSTCYAHQSRILVWPGQRVRRGQVIGRVGTTGASTGYHLHFEVRLNGDPTDPERFLPGCLC